MEHDAAIPLYRAWLAPDRVTRLSILGDLPVPGPIALRSRYRHLLDPQTPDGAFDRDLDLATWHEILDLETAGDIAVQQGELGHARGTFDRLATLGAEIAAPVVSVHAHIGQGDIARALDKVDESIAAYERAVELALTHGYRFGRLRALVPLGYLTIAYAAAGTAAERFTAAESLANELGDPLYRANAALGLAECSERHDDLPGAIQMALIAFHAFEKVASPIGMANAAYRAGAVLHRHDQPEQARPWLRKAHTLYTEVGDPVGLTNVLSGLGDLDLDTQDFDAAERWYVEGLRQAEAAQLPRARAHALQDVARVARGRAEWADAERRFETALAAYRQLDDVSGVWHALDKIAEAQAELGRPEAVVSTRLESVFAVEGFRAAHRDERSQREYRNRFGLTYSKAIAAAVAAGDAAAFVVVADCLAGRRLAGLIEASQAAASGEDLTLLQSLLAQADQRLVQHRRDRAGRTGESSREQRIRLLGAAGIRHGVADRGERSLDDQLAAVYLPPEQDGDSLLEALPSRTHVLQLLVDPVEPDLLQWMWRSRDGEAELGTNRLDADATGLLATLAGDDERRAHLRLADLAPLAQILPSGCAEALAGEPGQSLVVVPVGDLWMVPWSAVPLADRVTLGEAVRYAVCPSLTVQRQLAARAAAPSGHDREPEIDFWRSPLIQRHDLAGLDEPVRARVRPIASSAAARRRLRDGGEMMVVVGHGRPAPALGHYLELDDADWLIPADLLGATTPRRLALLACKIGTIEPGRLSDPISLATLALAARSDEVLATIGELGDSDPAAGYAEHVLRGMAVGDLPDAVHTATRWLLSFEDMRTERIFHWAPLIPIGTMRAP